MGKCLLRKCILFQTYLGGLCSSTATGFLSDHTSSRLEPGLLWERGCQHPSPTFSADILKIWWCDLYGLITEN